MDADAGTKMKSTGCQAEGDAIHARLQGGPESLGCLLPGRP